MSPASDDDEEFDWMPTRADAIELCFYRMDAGSILRMCSKNDENCPGRDDIDCPDCHQYEKLAGDTLEEFRKRCARLN